MRIAVCNTYARRLGGIESYLNRVIPALARHGHELATLFELDAPAGYPLILTAGGPLWRVAEVGAERSLDELRRWRPEVIFVHAINAAALEQRLLETAPAVRFVHDYAVTCISGSKAFAFPRPRPCTRAFGHRCLVNYFPRRCGGLNPITMVEQYRLRRRRLAMMPAYRRILVASESMRLEQLRHGLAPGRVQVLSPPVAPTDGPLPRAPALIAQSAVAAPSPPRFADPCRLLFAGRMLPLKGGEMLLEALPLAAARLGRALVLTMAGDGQARAQWEKRAAYVSARNPALTVTFTGWLDEPEIGRLLAGCDLLVVPSVWPEPFGLIGPEAGRCGVPAAAFATGGITQWLRDGVNGFLAPADPPTAAGLAEAIVSCLQEPRRYRQLRCNARREALKFGLTRHAERLLDILGSVVNEARLAGGDCGRPS